MKTCINGLPRLEFNDWSLRVSEIEAGTPGSEAFFLTLNIGEAEKWRIRIDRMGFNPCGGVDGCDFNLIAEVAPNSKRLVLIGSESGLLIALENGETLARFEPWFTHKDSLDKCIAHAIPNNRVVVVTTRRVIVVNSENDTVQGLDLPGLATGQIAEGENIEVEYMDTADPWLGRKWLRVA